MSLDSIFLYSTLVITFVTSIICLTRINTLDLPWKLIAIEVCIVFIVQLAASILLHFGKQNVLLLNLFMIVDLLLLGAAGLLFLRIGSTRTFMLLLGVLSFIACLIILLLLDPRRALNNVVFLISGLYVFTLYLFLLVQASADITPFKLPHTWLCIGVIIYFGCNVPFFSLFNYLSNNAERWKNLGDYLYVINSVLCVARYTAILYAIILVYKRHKATESSFIPISH